MQQHLLHKKHIWWAGGEGAATEVPFGGHGEGWEWADISGHRGCEQLLVQLLSEPRAAHTTALACAIPAQPHSAWRTRLLKPQECGWLLDSAINMKGFFYSFGHSAQITCCENSELSWRLDIPVNTLSKQDFSVFSSQQVGEAAPPRLWTTGLPRPLVCTVLSGCLGAGYETIYSTWHISMKYL